MTHSLIAMTLKRLLGPSAAVAILLLLASGVYLRIRGSSNADAEDAAPSSGERPEVSATATFRTDVAIPVTGAPVVRDTLVVSVTAAGEAAAWRESRLLAQVEGPVARIPVRENNGVGRGGLLVALDTTDLALTVYREITLFDDQIEDPAVRAEREGVARAKSGLDQARVTLRRRELDLERSRVVAPFAGRVASIMVTEGHRVRQGDELMTIVDIDPIKVEVQVLESEIGYLAEGRLAQVTFAAFPGEMFLGRIATINPVVERESRTARVTVTIPNTDRRVLPGMYARVSLEARRFPGRILVPKAAVLERDRRTMLFVFEGAAEGGLAKWNYVTTGLENDSLVEILDDPETTMLEPGQVVLIDGHYTLIHDARVRLVNNVRDAGGRPQ